jgi:hypothetical protein
MMTMMMDAITHWHAHIIHTVPKRERDWTGLETVMSPESRNQQKTIDPRVRWIDR